MTAADPEDRRRSSLMTLLEAIVLGDRPRVARLLATAPALAIRALERGSARGGSDTYFAVISHYAYACDTPLHLAAAACAADIAADLVSQGVDVRARNRRGAEPLHYAADGAPGSRRWDPAAQSSIVHLLVRAGADANAKDKSGVTPLHRAVRTRSAAAVRALLESGAGARLKNAGGSTPLHLAVQDTGRGGSGSPEARAQQREIIGLLLAHGARPGDRDARGTAVRDAARADGIRELLHGA
jgi:Ankyrin repeats (3 copies)/Ankyrin repeat